MNQRRGCRQTIPGIVKRSILICAGSNNVGDELAKSVEHQSTCVKFARAVDRIWVENPAFAIRARRRGRWLGAARSDLQPITSPRATARWIKFSQAGDNRKFRRAVPFRFRFGAIPANRLTERLLRVSPQAIPALFNCN